MQIDSKMMVMWVSLLSTFGALSDLPRFESEDVISKFEENFIDDTRIGETVSCSNLIFQVSGAAGWILNRPNPRAVSFSRPGSSLVIQVEAIDEAADVLLGRLLGLCQHAQAERFDAFGGDVYGLRVSGSDKNNILISRKVCFYPMTNTTIVVFEAVCAQHYLDSIDYDALDIINRNVARSVQPFAAAGDPVLEMREHLFEMVHPPVVLALESPSPKDLSKHALTLTEADVEDVLNSVQGNEVAISEGIGAEFQVPTTLAYLAGIWTVFLVVWPRATFLVTRQVAALLGAIMLMTWIAIMWDKLWRRAR